MPWRSAMRRSRGAARSANGRGQRPCPDKRARRGCRALHAGLLRARARGLARAGSAPSSSPRRRRRGRPVESRPRSRRAPVRRPRHAWIPPELAKDPPLALRAYAACVQKKAPILPFARDLHRAERRRSGLGGALARGPEAGPLFVELLCTVPDVPLEARLDSRRAPRSGPPARDDPGVHAGHRARATTTSTTCTRSTFTPWPRSTALRALCRGESVAGAAGSPVASPPRSRDLRRSFSPRSSTTSARRATRMRAARERA